MTYVKRKPWLAIALVVAFVVFSQIPPATTLAQDVETTGQPLLAATTDQRLIHVSGTGQVTVQPDVAVFFVGVETEAEDPGTAISQNSEQAQALIDALVQEGIPEENIQTQLVSLQPVYSQPEPTAQVPQTPQIAGYRAINIVQVRTEDLENLGGLLNSVVEAGGNRIDSLTFEASSQMAVFDAALQLAWEDAQQKAQLLAGLANAELGDVISIATSQPGPLGASEALGVGGAGGPVPIEPGTQTVLVNLQVTWELVPADGRPPSTPTPILPTPTSLLPTTITPTTGTPTTGAPTNGTPTVETPADETPTTLPSDVAASIRQQISEQLGLPQRSITIVSAERQDWPDACLGLARANEVCAEVVTPGWLVVIEFNERRFQVRTDLAGEEVRIVEEPTTAEPTTTVSPTTTATLTTTTQPTTTVQPTGVGQRPAR